MIFFFTGFINTFVFVSPVNMILTTPLINKVIVKKPNKPFILPYQLKEEIDHGYL